MKNPESLLTPAEVASLFRVCKATVQRWDKLGALKAVRTPGGHRRYRAADVRAAYEAGGGVWPA